MKDFYRKTDAIAALDSEDDRVWQLDINDKGAKRFLVGTVDEAWDVLQKEPWLYETFTEDSPTKFVFDLDITDKGRYKDLVEEVLETLIHCWNKSFKDHKILRKDILLMKTKVQPNKQSVHGVVLNYALGDIQDCKILASKMLTHRKSIQESGFDISVYRYGAWRTMLSQKRGKNYPFLWWNHSGCFQPETLSPKELWKLSLATWNPVETVLKIERETVSPRSISPIPSDFRCEDVEPTKVVRWLLYDIPSKFYDNYQDWVCLGYALKSYITEKGLSDDAGAKLFDAFSRRSIYYDAKAYDWFMKLPVPAKITWRSIPFWINQYREEDIPNTGGDSTYNQRYITDDEVKSLLGIHPSTAVVFPPGCGKTTSMCSVLREKKFISVTYRVALAGQQLSNFKKMGLTDVACYTDLKGKSGSAYAKAFSEFNSARGRIVQIDSLGKIDWTNLDEDTVVWLDESSALLDYLSTSPTLNNKLRSIQAMFSGLLKRTTGLILTDADLKICHREFINKIKEMETFVIDNSYIPEKDTKATILYDEEALVIQEVIRKLKGGSKNVIVCADSKTLIERISNSLPKGINKKVYTADEGDTSDIENNVDTSWEEHCVLYSPKIVTGVDYNVPSDVYGFFTGRSVSFRSFVQMIERTRNKLSLTISVTAKHKEPRFGSYDHVRNETLLSIKSYKQIFPNMERFFKMDSYGNPTVCDDPFTELFFHTVANRCHDQCFPRKKLEHLLKSRGYTVEIEEPSDKNVTEEIFSNKQLMELKEKESEEIRENIESDKLTGERKELNILQRIKYLKLDPKEIASEKGYPWKVVTDPMGISKHLKLTYSFMSDCKLKDRASKRVLDIGVERAVEADEAKYKVIQKIEKILSIECRYTLDSDKIWELWETGVNFNSKDFLAYIRNIFRVKVDIKIESGTVPWKDLYKILLSCWKQYFTKELVENKRIQKRNETVRIPIYYPSWQMEKIDWHRKIFNQM